MKGIVTVSILGVLMAGYLVLPGCLLPGVAVDMSIAEYYKAAESVQLGDSKEKVLAAFEKAQNTLPAEVRRSPEKYTEGGVSVEIYYFRSSRTPDYVSTDDEYTPYIFNDDRLVAIGWATLGGPKTRARPAERVKVDADIHHY